MYVPVPALTSDLADVVCQLSRLAMQSAGRLAYGHPRYVFRLPVNAGRSANKKATGGRLFCGLSILNSLKRKIIGSVM